MKHLGLISTTALSAALLWGCGSGGSSGETSVVTFPNISAPSPTSGGRLWYVSTVGDDTDAGEANTPLRRIQTAVDRAGPGDVIAVHSGVYTERVVFSGVADSGEPGAPVTLFSASYATGAIIDGSSLSPSGVQGLVTITNASHIIVDGFEVRNFATPVVNNAQGTPVGVLINGASQNIEVRNLDIHDIANRSTCTQTSGCGPSANGIGVFGDTVDGVQDIRLLNNDVYNNQLASSEAVTLNGNVSGFQVIGNSVRDNNNVGIDVIGLETDICPACSPAQNRARNGLVRGNTVSGNSNATNPWYSGANGNAVGIYVDGGEFIVVERNSVTGNDIGVEISSEAASGTANDILVASNLIYNNLDAGLVVGGFSPNANAEGGGSVSNLQVVNNTLYRNDGWGTDINLQYRVSASTFVNNIIYGANTQQTTLNEDGAPYTGLSWANNLWWADGAKDGVPASDATAISANPDFAGAASANFRLNAGSPAEDAGADVNDITTWSDPFWSEIYAGGVINGAGSADVYGSQRLRVVLDVGAAEQ